MSDTLDPKYFDKRTMPRHLRTGAVDEKLLDKHLKSLPDVTEKGAPVETRMNDEDVDEESDADTE